MPLKFETNILFKSKFLTKLFKFECDAQCGSCRAIHLRNNSDEISHMPYLKEIRSQVNDGHGEDNLKKLHLYLYKRKQKILNIRRENSEKTRKTLREKYRLFHSQLNGVWGVPGRK